MCKLISNIVFLVLSLFNAFLFGYVILIILIRKPLNFDFCIMLLIYQFLLIIGYFVLSKIASFDDYFDSYNDFYDEEDFKETI